MFLHEICEIRTEQCYKIIELAASHLNFQGLSPTTWHNYLSPDLNFRTVNELYMDRYVLIE